MTHAKLIQENGRTRTYQGTKGTIVIMEIDDDWTEIIFYDKKRNKFGEFVFKEIEDGSHKLIRKGVIAKPKLENSMTLYFFTEALSNVPIEIERSLQTKGLWVALKSLLK